MQKKLHHKIQEKKALELAWWNEKSYIDKGNESLWMWLLTPKKQLYT